MTKFKKYDTLTGKNILDDIKAEDIPLAGDKNFVFNQIVPSTVWEINHTLNKKASVAVVDSAGSLVHGLVKYIDDNTVQIEFKFSFAGTAYLN
ncbi:MAG: hypothetical protein KF896_14460 [Ignavibacteriae bacterium]|nr:hypothetical protein [Ignavibacteriota bacterium]